MRFAFGDSIFLRHVMDGSYFWSDERLYVKTGVTKDKGTFCLCHPVGGGDHVHIIQKHVNSWFAVGAQVNVAVITTDT